ncbi:MAG: hypothetical protein KDA78_14520 [Planctomycetaceae bacterium]|nr:hypothetical protein [Planctomycetaceae bacterium]
MEDLLTQLKSGTSQQRREAARSLATRSEVSGSVLLALIDCWQTDDEQLREWIAESLEKGQIQTEADAIQLARQLNRCPLIDQQWHILRILARSGVRSQSVYQIIRDYWHPDEAETVRTQALKTAASICPEESSEDFQQQCQKLLKDPSQVIASTAKRYCS